jgi:hypothetical protein
MNIGRKTFLKATGGATLAAIGFLYPGVAGVFTREATESRPMAQPAEAAPAANVRQMTGADPSYAGGEVVTKTAGGVILQSAKGSRAVRIPDGTAVWKEFDVGLDAIELHDWVDVKGTPLSDGSLLAQSGWVFVNIGRRDGVVDSLPSHGLTMRHAKGTETLELSPKLEVIHASNGAPLAGGLAALKPGAQIGAVGLRLPNGGFRATRIWTS